ncbi:MAG TPA: amidohydrolase family protein [Acidimicrobiales bacterium]|nr:amidohydrolase family protein [Acidimicrobiales bacterium]
MHDLVIRNGTVVDGSGGPAAAPGTADIAVDGDRVSAVGPDVGPGRREVDADGRLVTPGFVDIHTHYDGQATWDPEISPSSWHGVTTIVMGNCGVGFAPADPAKRAWLIQLMEGVEDIPGTALAEGMSWNWETFPEYLDELDRMARVVDVSALVPHGAVRAYVMGDRGGHNAEATPDEIEAMAKVVREAVEAGAVGFSTTRTLLHRAKDGELAAGTTASADELIGIGLALGDAGAGVFELASDMFDPEGEFAWMRAIARETGRPVTFNCLQDDLRPEHWRRLVELADEARAGGARIVPQVAGRPASVLFGWDSTAHPFVFHETWRTIADLARADRHARLRDPEVRQAMVTERVEVSGLAAFITSAWHKLFPLGDPPEYEPGPERSVQAIAAREGRTPQEVTYDLMMADDGRGLLYIPLLGYAHGDFDALREMLVHPGSVLGLGDGGAHCGLLCDASLPTYMLTHWVRDRSRGARLGLEQAVHMQTRSTASLYGFDDRGLLAPGYLADLNVIDLDALAIDAPTMVYDLPAGGRRLVQRARGYGATVKRGVVVREDDESTGERPGVLLRGAQPAPSA